MSTPAKDTIYIDIDDEITAIIEKVQAAKGKVVALVLPKRASVMQSTVNMRLLKRAADESNKNLVLITSEGALLPLAGAVGLHVARSLQSKPAVPPAPEIKDQPLTISDNTESSDAMETIDPKTPVGTLAGDEPTALAAADAAETIDVDNTVSEIATTKKAAKKPKPDKKLKVPNFERFRKWIILGAAGLVAFVIFMIWAFVIAPKAKVIIKTDTTVVASSQEITASPSAKSVDVDKRIVPATSKQVEKTDSTKASATGQKNNGNKATGTVTMSTSCSAKAPTVPSGTTISSNNLNFITQSDITLSSPSVDSSGSCIFSGSGNVAAQNAGDNYNLSARSYAVSGYSGISASGSAMTGGSNQIVKIISQQDVDNAKQQLLDKTRTAAITDLNKQFSSENMFALSDSTAPAGDPKVTAAPNVGEQADETTVSITANYAMLGMKKDDMKQLIDADVKQKIDTNAQKIQDADDGLGKATVKIGEKKSNGDVPFNIQVQITAGAQQDVNAIKQIVIGKKKGEALDQIRQRAGVKDASIQYSPFWITTTPKKASKITVVFEQSNGSK